MIATDVLSLFLNPYYPYLHSIANGEFERIDHLSARLKCDKGYKMKGGDLLLAATINCTSDGSWSLPLPKCVIANCDKPPFVENGNVRVSKAWWASQGGSIVQ